MKLSITQVLRAPSAEELAKRELEEAKRALLQAQTGLEYAAALVEYNTNRIHRLTALIQTGVR